MAGFCRIIVGYGYGKCIHPETFVSTINGPKKIKDLWKKNGSIVPISESEEVKVFNKPLQLKSFDNEKSICITNATKIYKQSLDEELVEISLENGEKILATKAHKFFIFNGELIHWKNIPQKGDYLLIPKQYKKDNSNTPNIKNLN